MKLPRTLQELFNAVQNGTGAKDVFLKEAKRLHSNLIPNAATFEQTVKIFKNRGVLNENYVDLKPINAYETYRKEESWETKYKSFLKEEEESIKAETTKASKYETDAKKNAYDNSDIKNLDNQIGQEVLNGIAFEARENPDKTLDEIRAIVSKNLAKDQLYYVKNAMFGEKGVGISDEVPGMKASKSDQMEPVKGARQPLSENYLNDKGQYGKEDDDMNDDDLFYQFKQYWKDANDKESKKELLLYYKTQWPTVYPKIENYIKTPLNEAKATKLEQRLKDIDKAGGLTTLEAKMEAIDKEIQTRQERIDMIGENEDLAELVNPAKLRELQKEVKILEKQKSQLQKMYAKMTGRKKAEVTDEPQEIEKEETDEMDEIYGSQEELQESTYQFRLKK